MMVSVFYAVPIYLTEVTGETGMWKVFVPAIAAAVFIMRFAVSWTQKGFGRQVLMISFLFSAFSLFLYFNKSSYFFLLFGTILFMSGYIAVATITAAKVNDTVDDSYRGTTNGIFNSFQYVGNFVGALITGVLWSLSEQLMWFVTIGFGITGFIIIALHIQHKEVIKKEDNL